MEIMPRKLCALGIRLLKPSVNGTIVCLSVVPEDLPSHPNYSNTPVYRTQCCQTTGSKSGRNHMTYSQCICGFTVRCLSSPRLSYSAL